MLRLYDNKQIKVERFMTETPLLFTLSLGVTLSIKLNAKLLIRKSVSYL